MTNIPINPGKQKNVLLNVSNELFKAVLTKNSDFMSLSDNEKLVLIVSCFEKDLEKFISNAWKLRENLFNK